MRSNNSTITAFRSKCLAAGRIQENVRPQFSYKLKLIIYYAYPRVVVESINYDVNEYYFSATLGLVCTKKTAQWSTETRVETHHSAAAI